ncbi:MAG: Fic family protein [Syntrophales bacterium]|nr:Fic family protein [Syntrophales bacterium]MDP3096507.1 Fic family protein [Syntrophales bacterium]
MKNVKPIWEPQYRVTTDMVRCLMDIEAIRTTVGQTALTTAVEAKMRRQARLHSTHYSTRIEGNRLTLAETEQVIQDRKAGFQGRERDVLEVKYYWDALLKVEAWAAIKRPLTENLIRRLHGWVEHGPRSRPTPFRDGQNVIRDSASGAIVYMPPEASDVPLLMNELVNWVSWAEKTGVPASLVAGLLHYQFVTIHPYYDGNGRTARLLATFILRRGGYGLHGFFSLEEFHARDLTAYYRALATHPHHNYYEGRANADLTPWMSYFLSTLADAFGEVRDSVTRHAGQNLIVEPEFIRRLDHRSRIVLSLFDNRETVTNVQVAQALGLSTRMARVLIRGWVDGGMLVVTAAARRNRAYGLSAIYRQYLDGLSAMRPKG